MYLLELISAQVKYDMPTSINIHVDNLFYKLFNNNSHKNVRPFLLFTKTTNETILNKINIILS